VIDRPSRRAPRVGLDNYGLYPLGLTPLATLEWAEAHGASGVAFSGLAPDQQASVTPEVLRDLAAFAADRGLYLEWGGGQHIPRDMTSWGRKDLLAVNRRAAEEAAVLGARIVRSCSGGLMRWDAAAPPTETLLRETAQALLEQRQVLRDHGVMLAIETHFEFTSYEIVRVFEMCDAAPGDWLGVCLDTMNLLTMLEEPASATGRLLPWVVSTHVKDGGVTLGADGLTTFPVEVGHGVIDLASIVRLLSSLPREVHLSVEDHGGSFHLPIYDRLFLSRFPDLSPGDLAAIVRLSQISAATPTCRPLARDRWPDVCEARIARDVDHLRRIVAQVHGDDAT
jgi:sugar phosphate isomerase/epimerase